MFDEQTSNILAKANLDLLCNVENFLGLTCILPLLECMQFLLEFAQAQDVFICDFIDVNKACERDLYRMYVDPVTSYGYGDGIFQTFLVDVDHTYDPLHMVWIVQPIFGVEYAGFQFVFFTHTRFIKGTH
jgi:hypothetical protein